MKSFVLLAFLVCSLSSCAQKDPYQDPTYTLQRNLNHRNQRWDERQKHMAMRRAAQDERYNAWFNSVTE